MSVYSLAKSSSISEGRLSNNDYVEVFSSTTSRRTRHFLFIADGVGTNKQSKVLARKVVQGIRDQISGSAHVGSLLEHISQGMRHLPAIGARNHCMTTLTGVCVTTTRSETQLEVYSLGDSPVAVLMTSGELLILTPDNGLGMPLTSYVDSLIGSVGTPFVKFLALPGRPIGIVAMSDGVTNSCTSAELRQFLVQAIHDLGARRVTLRSLAKYFLDDSASDNYSLALAYRKLSTKSAIRLLERLQ
ncbi:MAG: protein phosphatase 2C domain-containing protein [Fimbriimonadaceae bacterium]|nr:protein phosphatase 2C domain-containing protein [Fimbriimonadaceae bacterium]